MARSRDMSPNRIKYMLSLKKWKKYTDVDRAYNLPENMTSNTARYYPYEPAEKAIAEILGKHPSQIWPSRYDKQGNRLKPQPSHNYKQFCALRKDQKTEAA